MEFNTNYKGASSSTSYKVSFKINDIWCTGYILDKFRGIQYVKTNIGYGNGRNSHKEMIAEKMNPISVDFYLIRNYDLNEIYKVPCGDIVAYNEKEHKNNLTVESKKLNSEEALG